MDRRRPTLAHRCRRGEVTAATPMTSALDDLNNQRRLALRRPPFDRVVHRHTHRYVSPCCMSRFSLGRYTGTESAAWSAESGCEEAHASAFRQTARVSAVEPGRGRAATRAAGADVRDLRTDQPLVTVKSHVTKPKTRRQHPARAPSPAHRQILQLHHVPERGLATKLAPRSRQSQYWMPIDSPCARPDRRGVMQKGRRFPTGPVPVVRAFRLARVSSANGRPSCLSRSTASSRAASRRPSRSGARR